MLVVEFSITPIGVGEGVSDYVARAVALVQESGLDYVLTPMGTIVEGEWDQVFPLIRRCHDAVAADCSRVSVLIKVDSRRGPAGRLRGKVDAVEQKLGRPVRRAAG